MSSKEEIIQSYLSRFIELNNEERSLMENREDSEEYDKVLADFYKKKNEVSLNYIKDVNDGIIDTCDVQIGYLDSEGNSDTIYYDKIFIDLGEDETFTVLPPVIAEMEYGTDELCHFMDNHIDYTITKGTVYYGGPFPWSNVGPRENNTFTSRKVFENYIEQSNYSVEKYAELLSRDVLSGIEKYNQILESEMNKYISIKAKNDGLSDEQESYCLDILEEVKTEPEKWYGDEVGKDWNIDNIERILIGMVKKYDISVSNKVIHGINYGVVNFADACIKPYDLEQDNLEEYLYDNLELNKAEILRSFAVSDKMIDAVIAKALNHNASYPSSEITGVSQNRTLSNEQIRKVRESELSYYNKSEFFRNVFAAYDIPEEEIRDMLSGTEEERDFVLNYCTNVPEDYIESMFDDPDLYKQEKVIGYGMGYNTKNSGEFWSVLKNNQNLSVELVNKFKEYADKIGKQEGSLDRFYQGLISQNNISTEMMREILTQPISNITAELFLNRENKPEELIELVANSIHRDVLAKMVADGTISVNEEIYRKLALSNNIDDYVRKKLLTDSRFIDRATDLSELNGEFNIDYRNVRYGGDGPGSYDNHGGERNFYVNGVIVLSEKGREDSYRENF